MKKSLIVLPIIDVVLLLVYVIFRWLSIVNTGFTSIIDRLFATVLFGFSCVILIVVVIICIIQNKNVVDKKIKRNSFMILIVLLLLNIILPIVFFTIDNMRLKQSSESLDKATEELTKKVNSLIGSIRLIENNKYIYLYDNLLEIDNELKESIDKGSYVTYYDDKARVCISDENYKIYGNQGDFKVTKVKSDKERCHYSFADIGETSYQHNEGEYYLKYYINKKYNLEVNSVKTNYDCSTFTYCSIKNYEIATSNGTITAKLTVNDNKIEETDNYAFVYTSNLLQKDLKDYMSLNNYVIKPFVVTGDSSIINMSDIDINNLNNELWISFTIVVKRSNQTDENMKQIADKMANWYKDHKIYGSTNFILLDSKNYDEVNEDNYNSIKKNYNVNNFISCTVEKNGNVIID